MLPRASFRRQPPSGQKSPTVSSLHITVTPRNCCAGMLAEHADVVAGDLNRAAWRRDNSNSISIIEEAFCRLCFADASSLHHHPGGPGAVLGMWADVCGFLNHPDSDGRWKIRQHGAFSLPHETLGIRQTDNSCQHDVEVHLDFVERRSVQSHQERHD